MTTIDVTILEPRLKHPTIFQRFDELNGGESFIIHNDHDPKPLYYQMIAERGQIFDWEYLLSGPEFWQVRITRLNEGEKPQTIGEMAAADFRKAEVFKKYGIDFCCGGKKTLDQACAKKGIDVLKIQEELKAIDTAPETDTNNYNDWDLDFLADYIVNKHHRYVTDSHPLLFELSAKVARVHGDRHPELIEIAGYFNEIAEELNFHMQKEEMILFPYIKELFRAKKEGRIPERPGFGTIRNPISMMEAEHESAGGKLEEIRNLSNDLTPPVDACNSYRVLFGKLNEYDKDLHQHIHLENNILFVKAIALEEEFFG